MSLSQSPITWKDKVAVITGGASGIGLAIVKKCLSLQMKVVLADINKQEIDQTIQELQTDSSNILGVKTDVSKFTELEALAAKTYETFGRVDVLFNNAGVYENSFVWESSLADWEWVLGVNLMGVVHGIKAFIPRMIAQDTICYVINTSSLSALMSVNLGTYSVSKHAVVSLSETLQQSLALIHAKIQVSVFCPGFIKTKINSSERNRPHDLVDTKEGKESKYYPELEKLKIFLNKVVARGMDPDIAINILFKEIEEGKFYVLTHKDERTIQSIRLRHEGILTGDFKG